MSNYSLPHRRPAPSGEVTEDLRRRRDSVEDGVLSGKVSFEERDRVISAWEWRLLRLMSRDREDR